MSKLRVLFVSNFYPPSSWGGIQLYTHGVARELQQRGHLVQVICAGDWHIGHDHLNDVHDENYEGVPVRRLDLNWSKAPSPFLYLYNNPVTANEVNELIKEFRPDVIHITSASSLSASVIFAAKQAGVPTIATLADFWFICPRFTLLHADGHLCDAEVAPWQCIQCLALNAKVYRWPNRILPGPLVAKLLAKMGKIDWLSRQKGFIGMAGDMKGRQSFLRKALEVADVILSPSTYVKEAFAVQNMPADRIQPLAWGMPTGWTLPWQPRKSSEPLRVRYFGRIGPSKGINILLKAFKQVNGNAHLYIHGGGADKYELELHKLAADDNRITFAGPYKRQALGQLLARTDVTVVPSIWPETFCLVPRESLMAGVPVIASRIGAIPEAVKHEVNGLLVKSGDVQALASVLQRFIDEPDLYKRLIQSSRLMVKTVKQECDELIGIYEHF